MGQYDELDPGHGEAGPRSRRRQWNRHMMETDQTARPVVERLNSRHPQPENHEGGKGPSAAGVGAPGRGRRRDGQSVVPSARSSAALIGAVGMARCRRGDRGRRRGRLRRRAGWPAASLGAALGAARLPGLLARSSAARSARPVARASATRPRKRPRRATPSWWTTPTSTQRHDGRPRPPGGAAAVLFALRFDMTDRLRIAQVAPADRARPARGLRRHWSASCSSSSESSSRRGHDVTTFASGDSGGVPGPVADRPEALRRRASGRSVGFILGTMLMVLDHATEFDVIHSHLERSSLIARPRHRRCPVAATFHGRPRPRRGRARVLEPSDACPSRGDQRSRGRRPPGARLDRSSTTA